MSWVYATADQSIVTDGTGRFVPADPANADYAAMLEAATPIGAYVPPPPEPLLLPKVTILDRLQAAGLVEAAFQAMGGPGAYLYERWSAAADLIDTSNPLVLQVLDQIGADKAVILAP